MCKIGQSRGFSWSLLGTLLKNRFSLVGNVFKSLGKSALAPLGLTAAVSAIDAAIHKKMFGSSFTALTISKQEMKYHKIVKSFDESGLLLKGVCATKNEKKDKKWGFLRMLLDILGASLSVNLWAGKGAIKASKII